MSVIFESGLRSPAPALEFEIPSKDSVSFSRSGMKFTLKPGDRKVSGKPRCEAKLMDVFALGELVWIGLSIRLEPGWKYTKGETFLAQIHDRPADGDWSDWPSHPPLFALRKDPMLCRFMFGTEKRRSSDDFTAPQIFQRLVMGFRGSFEAAKGFGDGQLGNRARTILGGPSAYDGAGPSYFKFGIYCPEGGLTTPLSLTAKDIVVATTREECV